jgi:hypothetical protein
MWETRILDPGESPSSYTDSVMGSWGFSYDTLNRLAGAATNQTGNPNPNYCWQYDRGPRRQVVVAGVIGRLRQPDPAGVLVGALPGGLGRRQPLPGAVVCHAGHGAGQLRREQPHHQHQCPRRHRAAGLRPGRRHPNRRRQPVSLRRRGPHLHPTDDDLSVGTPESAPWPARRSPAPPP